MKNEELPENELRALASIGLKLNLWPSDESERRQALLALIEKGLVHDTRHGPIQGLSLSSEGKTLVQKLKLDICAKAASQQTAFENEVADKMDQVARREWAEAERQLPNIPPKPGESIH